MVSFVAIFNIYIYTSSANLIFLTVIYRITLFSTPYIDLNFALCIFSVVCCFSSYIDRSLGGTHESSLVVCRCFCW